MRGLVAERGLGRLTWATLSGLVDLDLGAG